MKVSSLLYLFDLISYLLHHLSATLLKDGIELAQYLSRNETKHVYMETDEEKVIMEIQYLRTLPEEKRAERLKELRSCNVSAKRASPLVTVVNSKSAFKATEVLVNCSSHFLDMPEMNIKWLHAQLCSIHGGVGEDNQSSENPLNFCGSLCAQPLCAWQNDWIFALLALYSRWKMSMLC